jgi:hypothetical protein
LCGAKPVQLILRVEPRKLLARFDGVADIDEPLDHSATNAERESSLVFRRDVPCQRHRLAGILTLDGDRPHRPRFGRLRLRLAAARCNSEDGDCTRDRRQALPRA